jgi:type IV fimbrial biogenesis protein FimT
MYKLYKQSGFTLLELLVSISVMVILMGVAAPSISRFLSKQRVATQVQVISSALSVARSEAINRSVNVFVCWNPTNANINVTLDGTARTILVDELVVVAAGATAGTSELVRNVSYSPDNLFVADDEADNCLSFDPQGRLADFTTPSLIFGVCRASGDDSDSRSVTVTLAGRAAIEDNTGGTQIACS